MLLERYETAAEAAKRLGIDKSRITIMCKQGRIAGARKLAENENSPWLVPKGSKPKPSRWGPKASWVE